MRGEGVFSVERIWTEAHLRHLSAQGFSKQHAHGDKQQGWGEQIWNAIRNFWSC